MALTGDGLIANWRTLTADDLGIGAEAHARGGFGSTAPDSPVLTSEHPMVQKAERLARQYGGVIFTGPPGTGKTYLAAETARLITGGDDDRMWFVQFHASYGYEDFMFGYVPVEGGFASRLGPFLNATEKARRDPEKRPHVVVIDELSRADVGRVFGEALTYVERSKRERRFLIASGEEIWVPSNLYILTTMNPLDRGVDEVDAAFERRFAKVRMDPDPVALDEILTDNGVEDSLRGRIVDWFRRINGLARKNTSASVGHAYFTTVSDEDSLRDLWEFQLQFLVERAFRLDEQTGNGIVQAWDQLFTPPSEQVAEPGTETAPEATQPTDGDNRS